MDSSSLYTEFYNFKPDRALSTTKEYSNRVSNLCKELAISTHEELFDADRIINHLEKKREAKREKTGKDIQTTLSNIIGAVMEYLIIKDCPESSYRKYQERKVIADDFYRLQNTKGGLINNQADNFITEKELLNYCETINQECFKNHLLKTNGKPDVRKIHDLINLRLILNLLINHPSRNEYALCEFIKWRDYKKIPNDQKKNYIVIPSGKPPFISVTEYKTNHKYGEKVTVITDLTLKRLIRDQVKKNGFNAVFIMNNGKKFDPVDLAQLLCRYSQKHLKKNISSTMICKILNMELGEKYNESLENNDIKEAIKVSKELSENARTRGHSKSVQRDIYLKSV